MKYLKITLLLLALLITAGCMKKLETGTGAETMLPRNENGTLLVEEEAEMEQPARRPPSPIAAEAPELPSKRPERRTGILGMATTKPEERPLPGERGEQPSVLNFDRASIRDVAQQIFGEYLKVSYVIDPQVQGHISLYFEGEYSDEELLRIISYSFRTSGVDVVQEDGVFVIRPLQRSNTNIDVADSLLLKQDEKGYKPFIVIFRPRFVKAEQAEKLVKLFLTPGRILTTDPMTNSVIFVEEQSNARKIIEVLRALDINLLDELGMEVVQLQSLSPDEAVSSMESITEKLAVFKQSSLSENLVFIPLKNFNGVLILSNDQEVLAMAKQWLEALDVRGAEVAEQIEVYHMQNGLAKNVTELLNQVFENRKSAKQAVSTKSQRVVTAEEQPQEIRPASLPLAAEITGDVALIPDEVNNAIIIRAGSNDMIKIKEIIRTLDIVPRAVLIEMIIAEVRLSDELQYGVEWFLRNREVQIGADDFTLSTGSGTGNQFNPDFQVGAGLPSGFSLFLGSSGFASFLRMLSADNDVNILSTPTLLAMDHSEASIMVGGTEPTITRTSKDVATDTNIIQDIQYQDTGIQFTVTPHINAGGLVRLEVQQDVTNVNEEQIIGVDLNTPRFTKRQVRTSLVAEDGKTVVIGGIIQTENTLNRSGVPILRDIPIVNFFFSGTRKEQSKTELLVAITPHVIDRRDDSVTRELVRRLNKLRTRTPGEK